MKVIKIGGGCLKGKENVKSVLALIAARGAGDVFVVSALGGVTDMLLDGAAEALADEERIPDIVARLRNEHLTAARHVIVDGEKLKEFNNHLNKIMDQLARWFYGLNFTREFSPRLRDVISCQGEGLSACLLAMALQSRGLAADSRDPRDIGIISDGRFGDASANMKKTSQNLQQNLRPLLDPKGYMFIPGFYGVNEEGDITTFGRGGSDYSAAVVAAALEADILETWKDVAGFMSADPKFVPEAQLIPSLSYEEAAELAYFGAKILHPRTIEPLRESGLNIAVKNTLDPDAPGTLITAKGDKPKNVVKSVAYDTDIGVLKIHGSGVGARPGILATITGLLSGGGINIRSVITSQTCISLLLSHRDLDKGYKALQGKDPKPFLHLEKIENLALVGIVGEGLSQQKGIAARCFSAVADSDVNIEMISFGPSRVALYFLLVDQDLTTALKAIHRTFFQGLGDEVGRAE
ncbi:MAG: aspartate kinase [Pseudomonadota bacterium]